MGDQRPAARAANIRGPAARRRGGSGVGEGGGDPESRTSHRSSLHHRAVRIRHPGTLPCWMRLVDWGMCGWAGRASPTLKAVQLSVRVCVGGSLKAFCVD